MDEMNYMDHLIVGEIVTKVEITLFSHMFNISYFSHDFTSFETLKHPDKDWNTYLTWTGFKYGNHPFCHEKMVLHDWWYLCRGRQVKLSGY